MSRSIEVSIYGPLSARTEGSGEGKVKVSSGAKLKSVTTHLALTAPEGAHGHGCIESPRSVARSSVTFIVYIIKHEA